MMVTREAMPAREAMRDNRGAIAGESRRRISYANGIPSENAGQLLVCCKNMSYNFRVGLQHPQTEWPRAACNSRDREPSPKETSAMNKYSNSPIRAQSEKLNYREAFPPNEPDTFTYTLEITASGIKVTPPNGEAYATLNITSLTSEIHHVQRRLVNRWLIDNLDAMVKACTWIKHDVTKKPPTRGNCVYFARSEAFPGLIKIGLSTALRQRMKTLGHEHKCAPFVPVAYAFSPNISQLEHALHIHFDAYLADGLYEYFKAEPILDWLGTVLS